MKTIPIDQASEAELRAFATDALKLQVHPNAKVDTIRAKIAASGYDAPTIAVADAPPMAVNDPGEAQEPWFTVEIAESSESGGNDPVPVCVSGRNMWIERGKPQRIKHRYYEALKNAIRKIYEQPEGPRGPTVEREVHAYPFQVLAAPAQAELDAWSKFKADRQAEEVAAKRAEMRAARGIAAA